MKKNFKKIFALVLAALMLLSMTAAFAANDASITITHDSSYEGATGTTARVYEAYKIFDAEYTSSLAGVNTQAAKDTFTYNPEDAAVSYSMANNSPWLSVMLNTTPDNPVAGTTYQTWFDVKLASDGSKYIVTPKSGAITTAAQAKAFGEYLSANIPSNAPKTEVTVDGTAAAVEKGYYLIVAKDSKDAVTRIAVVTTDVTMVEKNTYITTSKTVSETSYNVGETITYTATVTIPSDTALTQRNQEDTAYVDGHGPVILHDHMDSRLTFGSVTGAMMDSAAFNDYTVNTQPSDSDTFDITIPVTSSVLGKTITFTYTAIINETAENDEGFINDLFGENNGYKTNKDEVKVWTFDIKLNKTFTGVTGSGVNNDYEAKFELRTTANDASTAIKFNQDTTTKTKYVKVDGDTANEGSTELTVHHNETIDMIGLKAGTYWLVETDTKAGYNKLENPIEVKITDTTDKTTTPYTISHTVEYKLNPTDANYTTATNHIVPVANNKGSVLPSTGGIGTTIFYIGGSILVLAAAILLITKRRMSSND